MKMRATTLALTITFLIATCERAALAVQDTTRDKAGLETVNSPEDPMQPESSKPGRTSEADAADSAELPAKDKDKSSANRIVRLQSVLEEDHAQLEKLAEQLKQKNEESETAAKNLTEMTKKIELQKKALKQLKDVGNQQDAAKLQKEIAQLEKEVKLAKEAFDLILQVRTTLQEQVANLEQKTAQDQESLDKLRGKPEMKPKDEEPKDPADTDDKEEKAEQVPAGKPPTDDQAEQGDLTVISEHVLRAAEERKEKEQEAKQAREEVKDLAERIVRLEKDLELEQEGLAQANERIESLRRTLRARQDALQQKTAAGASGKEIDDLQRDVSQTQSGLREAEAEIQEKNYRIIDLRQNLLTLREQKVKSDQVATEKLQEAEAAKFSELIVSVREGTLRWFRVSGPKVLIVLGIAVVLWLVIELICWALLRVLSMQLPRISSGRTARAKTLVHILKNTITIMIFLGSVVIALNVSGVPMSTLLGSAAVVGLAVAFATQNVLRDHFHGMLITLEQQYALNDEVTINGMTGKVENITLRLTVLRDFEGNTHFIPNGGINTVTNRSYLWSRAVIEVEISAKADLDEMTNVLSDIANELRCDEMYGDFVLNDPEMLGVSDLDGSSVTLKFGLKTLPNKKAEVRRELLRRIKNKFGEIAAEQGSEEVGSILV